MWNDLSRFSQDWNDAEMKLMFVVIRDTDSDSVVQLLVENHYQITRVASKGGFMRHGNVTLLTGFEESPVQSVIDLLHQACCPPEEEQHRAAIFVVDVPYFSLI